jgi:hypothetical protein
MGRARGASIMQGSIELPVCVDVLHDVNLATRRPTAVDVAFRQHPVTRTDGIRRRGNQGWMALLFKIVEVHVVVRASSEVVVQTRRQAKCPEQWVS